MAYSNVMRYTGLSGVDTASIVEGLMKVEGLKYDNLFKKNAQYTYKQEAYRSVGNSLYSIQKDKFDVLSSGSLRKASTFKASKTTVKDSSGNASSAVGVKLGTGVTNFNQSIKVNQLATSDTVTLKGSGYNNKVADSEVDVDSLKSLVPNDGDTVSMNLTLDGTTREVTLSKEELASATDADSLATVLNKKLSDTFGASVANKASFATTDGKIQLKAETGHSLKLSSTDGVVENALGFNNANLSTAKTGSSTVQDMFGMKTGDSFTVNGSSVTITDGMSVDQFVSEYNKLGNGSSMSYSANTGVLTMKSKSTGVDGAMDIGTDLSKLSKDGVTRTTGQDAEVEIDGEKIYLSKNEMSFADGTSLTFNAKTEGVVTVNTSNDTDVTKNAIKSFVDTYNSLLKAIYDQTKTTRPTSSNGSTYEPLTDEEKADMSATEIEKWEENAKKGLLYKDNDLRSIERKLRDSIASGVKMSDGSTVRLSDLGISLNEDYAKGGLLTIDEEKLDAGIERLGSDKIASAFTNTANGFSTKVNNVLKETVGSNGTLTQKVGLDSSPLYKVTNTMSTRINQNQATLKEMFERLAKKEERYYKMFSYMEESITNSNSQLSSLGLG